MIEHAQTETFSSLEKPFQPEATILVKFQQEFLLVTAVRDMSDPSRRGQVRPFAAVSTRIARIITSKHIFVCVSTHVCFL
jgi:hypothetical protein